MLDSEPWETFFWGGKFMLKKKQREEVQVQEHRWLTILTT